MVLNMGYQKKQNSSMSDHTRHWPLCIFPGYPRQQAENKPYPFQTSICHQEDWRPELLSSSCQQLPEASEHPCLPRHAS